MSTTKRKPEQGIEVRHAKACRSKESGRCSCRPSYRGHVWSARDQRRIRGPFFPSIAQARNWRQDAVVALRRGTMRAPCAQTVAEAAAALLEGMQAGTVLDRSGKPYKPATRRSYAQALNAYVLPRLGDRKLSAVARRDVQDFVDSLRAAGLSPSTVANKLDPLRVLFRRAVERDAIAVDPTKGLRLPAVRGKRDRIEAPERAAALIAALPEGERALWAVAFYGALRRGELRALTWTCVDFDEGVVRVEWGWDDYVGRIEVKSDAGRRAVPLGAELRRILIEHKLRTGRSGDELVLGRTPHEPFVPTTARRRARKAWAAVGLEPLTPHEARHCAASYFVACGMDWKQIATWIGHGDVRQTWNRYAHVVPGDEKAAAAKLDAYLSRAGHSGGQSSPV